MAELLSLERDLRKLICMLLRLTKRARIRTGWIAALLYLLCVIAPAVAYAMPSHHSAMPCLPMSVTSETMLEEVYVPSHDHSTMHGMPSHDAVTSAAIHVDHDGGHSKKDQHNTGAKCCATMCMTALPASVADFSAPPLPRSQKTADSYSQVADNTPSVPHRPPKNS